MLASSAQLPQSVWSHQAYDDGHLIPVQNEFLDYIQYEKEVRRNSRQTYGDLAKVR